MHTVVVGADLESLVPPHHQPGLAVFLVLQQLDIAGTALLPLLRLGVELEQLSTPISTRLARNLSLNDIYGNIHFEGLLLLLLVCLNIRLLEVDEGLKVDFWGLGCFVLPNVSIKLSGTGRCGHKHPPLSSPYLLPPHQLLPPPFS